MNTGTHNEYKSRLVVKYKETEMYAKCHKTQQTKPSSLNKNVPDMFFST